MRLCTLSTLGGTSGNGSALNPVRVSSAENPVPDLLFARHTRQPPLGLLRQVLNVHFTAFPKDGLTAFLDLDGAQKRFFGRGFCQPSHFGSPNVSDGSSVELCDLPTVEATDHQSYLTGHPSRLPIDWMFQFDWSSQHSPRDGLLCWSNSSRLRCFYYFHFFLKSSPAPLSVVLALVTHDLPWLVGRCHGALEGCTALRSVLLRRLCEDVVALSGHHIAKRIDQALMRKFSNSLLYMAMQAYLSERILLAGEMIGDSIQSTHGIFEGCAPKN